jgi:hypothetical protein
VLCHIPARNMPLCQTPPGAANWLVLCPQNQWADKTAAPAADDTRIMPTLRADCTWNPKSLHQKETDGFPSPTDEKPSERAAEISTGVRKRPIVNIRERETIRDHALQEMLTQGDCPLHTVGQHLYREHSVGASVSELSALDRREMGLSSRLDPPVLAQPRASW